MMAGVGAGPGRGGLVVEEEGVVEGSGADMVVKVRVRMKRQEAVLTLEGSDSVSVTDCCRRRRWCGGGGEVSRIVWQGKKLQWSQAASLQQILLSYGPSSMRLGCYCIVKPEHSTDRRAGGREKLRSSRVRYCIVQCTGVRIV